MRGPRVGRFVCACVRMCMCVYARMCLHACKRVTAPSIVDAVVSRFAFLLALAQSDFELCAVFFDGCL